MKELQFDTGLVSYNLNGKCEVQFNPADREFVERFYNAFDELGNLSDEYSKKTPDEVSAVFDIAKERDGKMQKIIDDLFAAPVCETAFDGVSVCAFANGFPVWANLMFAVLDEIMANLDDVENKADPRIARYKAKYQKYHARYHK